MVTGHGPLAGTVGDSLTVEWLTRAVVVLGLGVDARVHLRMAPVMDIAAPGGIGGGNLLCFQGP